MSLIANEIQKLEEFDREIAADKADIEKVKIRLCISRQKAVYVNLQYEAVKLEAAHGLQATASLEKAGFIGDAPVMSLQDIKNQKIYCPAGCADITRQECEEESSGDDVSVACQTCDNYVGTRRQLRRAKVREEALKETQTQAA